MPHRLRALIVEDSPLILKRLQELLEELAEVNVVGTAASAQEACEWCDTRTQACDIAILDMFLEAGTGLDVLKHMSGYDRPPVVIVLTNYATDAIRERCTGLGAAEVFDKSTEIDGLVSWLVARVRH